MMLLNIIQVIVEIFEWSHLNAAFGFVFKYQIILINFILFRIKYVEYQTV